MKKRIKKQYTDLLKIVKTSNFFKTDLSKLVNCYVCECGHITKTIDVDAGVTPFFHICEKCGQKAKSTLYIDIAPQQQPTQEWYRPSLDQVISIKNNDSLVEDRKSVV